MRRSRRDRRLTLGTATPVVAPLDPADTEGSAGAAAERRADRYVAEVRRILGRFGTRRRVAKGDPLFGPEDRARHLYIIESGRIDASLPDDSGNHPLASFHPGATFVFDFGGQHVALCEAGEDSVVIDLPYGRLKRLSRQGMELRLLLRQCHAFDLKSFLDICYPAGSRLHLARAPGRERLAESGDAEKNHQEGRAAGRSPHPGADATPKPPSRRSRSVRRRSGGVRAPGGNGVMNGEDGDD